MPVVVDAFNRAEIAVGYTQLPIWRSEGKPVPYGKLSLQFTIGTDTEQSGGVVCHPLAVFRLHGEQVFFGLRRYHSRIAFTITQAAKVGKAVLSLQQERLTELHNSLRSGIPEHFTFLPGFTFTVEDVLEPTGESESAVSNVLNAFTISDGDRNDTFRALNDFNLANAHARGA